MHFVPYSLTRGCDVWFVLPLPAIIYSVVDVCCSILAPPKPPPPDHTKRHLSVESSVSSSAGKSSPTIEVPHAAPAANNEVATEIPSPSVGVKVLTPDSPKLSPPARPERPVSPLRGSPAPQKPARRATAEKNKKPPAPEVIDPEKSATEPSVKEDSAEEKEPTIVSKSESGDSPDSSGDKAEPKSDSSKEDHSEAKTETSVDNVDAEQAELKDEDADETAMNGEEGDKPTHNGYGC